MSMRSLLLLGITEPSAPPVFSTHPYIRLNCDSWAALALPVELEPMEDEAARMTRWALAQGEVLCRQIRVSDVLPVRLGAVFSTAPALTAHLDKTEDALIDAAARCAGRVEFAVQAFTEEAASPEHAERASSGGRAYLEGRRRARDRRSQDVSDRRRFLADLGRALAEMGQNVTAKDVQGRAHLAEWAVLLPRGAVDPLVDALEILDDRARRHGLSLKLTGPWPPFTFIGLS